MAALYISRSNQFGAGSELELISLRLLTKMASVPSRVETSSESSSHSTSTTVFCPGFQKGRVPSQKGTFSVVNGLSKGHFSAVNGLKRAL